MLTYHDEELFFDGVSLKTFADQYETPFFLISEQKLRTNYSDIESGLSANGASFAIRYCAKTNNEIGVLRVLSACGSHVLVSHFAEAQLALKSGFEASKIAYQRPIMTEPVLEELVEHGVRTFHAFRISDIQLLEQVAERTNSQLRISLRFHQAGIGVMHNPLSILSGRFGFSEKGLLHATELFHDSNFIKLSGINVYIGTQQTSPLRYRSSIRRAAVFAKRIYSQYGIQLGEINLGGGIPSPTVHRSRLSALSHRLRRIDQKQEYQGTVEDFSRELSAIYAYVLNSTDLPATPALVVEPGRAVVGNSAILVSRVQAIQGNWVFLDASRNFLGENPVLFTRRILPATLKDRTDQKVFHFSGSTLNTLDIVDLFRRFPEVQPGEIIALCDVGAYSISRASRYAGLPPAIYMLQADVSVRLIRRAEGVNDLRGAMVHPQSSTPAPEINL